jgi:hypothetical protein
MKLFIPFFLLIFVSCNSCARSDRVNERTIYMAEAAVSHLDTKKLKQLLSSQARSKNTRIVDASKELSQGSGKNQIYIYVEAKEETNILVVNLPGQQTVYLFIGGVSQPKYLPEFAENLTSKLGFVCKVVQHQPEQNATKC